MNKTKKIIIFISLLLLLLLWGGIPQIILIIFKLDYDKIPDSMKVLLSFINDLLLLIIFISIYKKTIKKDFHDYFNKNYKNNIKESFSTWLIGFGIMIASNLLIAILTKGQLSQNEETVRGLIDKYPLYMTFQVMLYAPITEELIFRKSIKDFITNKKLYIIISGLIFGGLHVITSITSNPLSYLYLIPYCSLGFVFAYLYQKTDNIFSTTVAHSFHNSLALLIYLRRLF